jgi:hypothetical protein
VDTITPVISGAAIWVNIPIMLNSGKHDEFMTVVGLRVDQTIRVAATHWLGVLVAKTSGSRLKRRSEE